MNKVSKIAHALPTPPMFFDNIAQCKKWVTGYVQRELSDADVKDVTNIVYTKYKKGLPKW